MSTTTKIVLITGATSGIGEACAELYAANNFDLIITGRREEKLNDLKQRLEKEFNINVTTLCFDVSQKDEVEKSLNNQRRFKPRFRSHTGWKNF
jgi:3-hydroxy acid dehydrogenase/malonic semialdehyde reductase